MKIKGLLMLGAALVVGGVTNTAQASERLSLHEVNNFVARMTNAVNSPDSGVTASFLERNVASSATFSDTTNATWVDGRYVYAWSGYNVSPYYRYPYGYTTYMNPTSYNAVGKSGMINKVLHKKNMVPRYHTSMSILSTRMPADASSAVIDVNLREFGLNYAIAPYGLYHGQKLEHANARCTLHLSKSNGSILLNKMDCNTVTAAPLL